MKKQHLGLIIIAAGIGLLALQTSLIPLDEFIGTQLGWTQAVQKSGLVCLAYGLGLATTAADFEKIDRTEE